VDIDLSVNPENHANPVKLIFPTKLQQRKEHWDKVPKNDSPPANIIRVGIVSSVLC